MSNLTQKLTLAACGLWTWSVPALAHAHLTSATPAINGTVTTTPRELDLVFSEGLNLRFTGVTLTGPSKDIVAVGKATLGARDDATLVVPVPATLAAGAYKVEWHALSSDGHKTSGSYTFTINP